MATRKRNVEIRFLVDDKQVNQKLGNIDGAITKTGKAFSNAAKAAATFIAGRELIDFGRDSVRAFVDLNESVNAVNVVFGEAAAGVKALGEQAAESVGLSNSQFNSLAVGFSAFAEKIAAGGGDSVVDVIDDLTVRIADFASVMNLDVSEAAEKFRSGLAGETEPLRKFGIDVSAAAVSAEALAMGLGSSSGKLSEQDKILARYSLIMKQTNKTAGDFANTSDELANKQRILAARIEDAKVAIGESLVPAVEAALPLIEDFAEGIAGVGTDLTFAAGGLTRAEKNMRDFQLVFGRAPETIDDVKVALGDLHFAGTIVGSMLAGVGLDFLAAKTTGEEFDAAVRELFHNLDLNIFTLAEVRNGVDEWGASLGLNETKILSVKDATRDMAVAAIDAGIAEDQAAMAAAHLDTKLEELNPTIDLTAEALRRSKIEAKLLRERLLEVVDEDVLRQWEEAAALFGLDLGQLFPAPPFTLPVPPDGSNFDFFDDDLRNFFGTNVHVTVEGSVISEHDLAARIADILASQSTSGGSSGGGTGGGLIQ